MVNPALASQPHLSQKVQECCGRRVEPNTGHGQHLYNVTPMPDNHIAAKRVNAVMKYPNPMCFHVLYCRKHANGTAGAKTPTCGGCSYHSLDHILQPPGEAKFDKIWVESDNNVKKWRSHPRTFTPSKTGFT
jgi:hypothetical protein